MLNVALQETITRRLKSGTISSGRNLLLGTGISLLSIVLTISIQAVIQPGLSDDELAKLATLTARSKGMPVTIVWEEAKARAAPWRSGEAIARELLVDLDLRASGVRQALNGDGNNREMTVRSPGDRDN